MDMRNIFFIFISTSAILTSASASANQRGLVPPKIKAICDLTSSPDICSNSIAQFLDGKTDVGSVLRMQITATMNTIGAAVDESKRRSHEPGVDKITSKRLKGCAQLYSSAIDYYKEALKALKTSKVDKLKTELDSVTGMISTCDDTMTGDKTLPDSENPLSKINLLIKKMNGNCFDLNKLFLATLSPSTPNV